MRAAKKVEIDGHVFDSKREAARYEELRLLLLGKEIGALTIHPKYDLWVNGHHVCDYTADFAYADFKSGNVIVEDVKSGGSATARDFRLRLRLMRAIHGIEVRVVDQQKERRPRRRR